VPQIENQPGYEPEEITPEMIEAGVAALLSWDPVEDPASVIAKDVYRQMLQASRESRSLMAARPGAAGSPLPPSERRET
jgi:hypothetical protein